MAKQYSLAPTTIAVTMKQSQQKKGKKKLERHSNNVQTFPTYLLFFRQFKADRACWQRSSE
jgi:hypothetical protein